MTNYCFAGYRRIIKYSIICVMIFVFLFGVLFTIHDHSLYHLYFSEIEYEENLLFINQSSSSSLTYHIRQMEFYPHLPIQIYTTNRNRFLTIKNKTKKIILLANPFFDYSSWTIKSLDSKTNAGDMSEVFCPFLNNYCELTNDITRFKQADAVVYHMINKINRSNEIMKHRHSSQRFIFALWEPPTHTRNLRSYDKFFNWSMTYRFDSHIYASYYAENAYHLRKHDRLKSMVSDYQSNEEIVVLHENIDTTKKKGTAAALISNCVSNTKQRLLLISKLQKHIDVTIYGKCGKPCPKSTKNETIDCRAYIAENYYFMLAFENSYCHDYTTEKLFAAIKLPIIPVVFGQVNYTRFIPESAFIDIRQFSTISELANRLIQIRNNSTLYQEYFKWKKDFIWDRFSHFMTPLCDLCLRLHLDTTPNIIDSVHQWWFRKTCRPEVRKYF